MQTIQNKKGLKFFIAVVTLWAGAALAQSGNYPNKPIKFIVPYPPGGGTDVIARIVQEPLRQNLGPTKQTILVANNRDMYFKQDLINAIQPLGLGAENILYIGDTRGQAHTAAIGMTQLEHIVTGKQIGRAHV